MTEENKKDNDINYCPVCKERFKTTIKSPLRLSRCKNGHAWHKCSVHGKVLSLPVHNNLNGSCTCKKENKKEEQKFIKVGTMIVDCADSMLTMNKVMIDVVNKTKEGTGLEETGVSYNYLDTFKINDMSFLLNSINRDLEHLKRVVKRQYE